MKTTSDHNQLLEALEARIAPASATFVDVDGDIVTITTSKGTSTDITNAVTGGANSEIEKVDLTNDVFIGTNIKVAVTTRVAGGDGVVNVWAIDSTDQDLGSVEVGGDLAKLTVGDTNYANGSVKSVKVQSIGSDNSGASDKVWLMKGSTTTFNVAGNVNGAELAWTNPDAGGKVTVTSIVIGGNLTGGTTDESGSILLSTGAGGTAELKSVSIGGNLTATDYNSSGSIIVGNTASASDYTGIIGKVTIGGSMTGDNNHTYSGSIFAANTIGTVTVGGSLTGGDTGSGSIFGYQKITGDHCCPK